MTAIKTFASKVIQSLLESRGKEILNREARNGPSIPLLSLLIERCALAEGVRGVVQIGANDGLMDDPVRQSIVSLGLPALLVEPLPDVFDRLQRNYSDHANVVFENVAIGEQQGEAEMFRVRFDAVGFPGWVHGLASFDKAVLLKHRSWEALDGRDLASAIESVRVPVITFGQLLERHPEFGDVTVVQIDTEGHDYAVVQSLIAASCLPRIINYEHKHLPYVGQVACRDLLASKDYSFASNTSDTLAYRMPFSARRN